MPTSVKPQHPARNLSNMHHIKKTHAKMLYIPLGFEVITIVLLKIIYTVYMKPRVIKIFYKDHNSSIEKK